MIAVAVAAGFTVGMLAWGPTIYEALGGHEETLEAALGYSTVVFAGAVTPWLFNTLASIVRGAGTMGVPAAAIAASAVADLLLSPAFIFGWGPLPRLGVAGAGVGFVTAFALGSVALGVYLLAPRSSLRLAVAGVRLEPAVFAQILRVGAPGCANVVVNNLTVMLLTGLAAPLGAAALAGYGVAARLEYIVIPLAFGVGTAIVAMVGSNVGAGLRARAERIAWTGAGVIAAITAMIGLAAALRPALWVGIFTDDAKVLEAGFAYLRIVGPVYGVYGLALGLYFASQGFGRLGWPVMANVARLGVAVGGGWLVTAWWGGGLGALCGAMAAGVLVYGGVILTAINRGAWRVS